MKVLVVLKRMQKIKKHQLEQNVDDQKSLVIFFFCFYFDVKFSFLFNNNNNNNKNNNLKQNLQMQLENRNLLNLVLQLLQEQDLKEFDNH